LCKINPGNPGCGGGRSSGSGGSKPGAATGAPRSGSGAAKNQQQPAQRSTKASADFQEEIAQGKIPGTPGKDYPTNNLDALRKKHPNIAPAPDHLITPDYPGLGGKGASGAGAPKGAPAGAPRGAPKSAPSAGGAAARKSAPAPAADGASYCAGGKLEECIKFCPSDADGSEFSACVSDCGTNCSS